MIFQSGRQHDSRRRMVSPAEAIVAARLQQTS
jgi:hypothetical protein